MTKDKQQAKKNRLLAVSWSSNNSPTVTCYIIRNCILEEGQSEV